MAITTKPLAVPNRWGDNQDRVMLSFLTAVIDRIEKPRVEAVADLNQTIAGPSVAEVQALSDKMDELLAALRTANILEE